MIREKTTNSQEDNIKSVDTRLALYYQANTINMNRLWSLKAHNNIM